jgi:hypothetical protein
MQLQQPRTPTVGKHGASDWRQCGRSLSAMTQIRRWRPHAGAPGLDQEGVRSKGTSPSIHSSGGSSGHGLRSLCGCRCSPLSRPLCGHVTASASVAAGVVHSKEEHHRH